MVTSTDLTRSPSPTTSNFSQISLVNYVPFVPKELIVTPVCSNNNSYDQWKLENKMSYNLTATFNYILNGDTTIVSKTIPANDTVNINRPVGSGNLILYVQGFSINVGSSGSACQVQGLDDKASANIEMLVYPNPANEEVKISINEKGKIAIHNIMGILIEEQNIDHQLAINTSQYPSGVYVVTYSNANKVVRKKIVVRR